MQTKATRKKISKGMMGNTNGLGKKRPLSAIRATADALRGIPRSKKVKEKISKSKKGQMLGEKHPNWKGGKITDKNGYIHIKMREHPQSNSIGYIREHRVVMEKKIGRMLKKNEDVHHKNGTKTDNRPENLELLTRSTHAKVSYKLRRINHRGQLI